jgi:hypothetical protein
MVFLSLVEMILFHFLGILSKRWFSASLILIYLFQQFSGDDLLTRIMRIIMQQRIKACKWSTTGVALLIEHKH